MGVVERTPFICLEYVGELFLSKTKMIGIRQLFLEKRISTRNYYDRFCPTS